MDGCLLLAFGWASGMYLEFDHRRLQKFVALDALVLHCSKIWNPPSTLGQSGRLSTQSAASIIYNIK